MPEPARLRQPRTAPSSATASGTGARLGFDVARVPVKRPGQRRDLLDGRPTQPVATRATHRLLMLRGLAADEAANVTAYLCGLPVVDRHWQMGEINRLLFLRELTRSGRFGARDGEAD